MPAYRSIRILRDRNGHRASSLSEQARKIGKTEKAPGALELSPGALELSPELFLTTAERLTANITEKIWVVWLDERFFTFQEAGKVREELESLDAELKRLYQSVDTMQKQFAVASLHSFRARTLFFVGRRKDGIKDYQIANQIYKELSKLNPGPQHETIRRRLKANQTDLIQKLKMKSDSD